MTKALRYLVVIIALIVGGGFLYYYCFFGVDELSPDQQEIIDTFGYPQRFTISYLQYAEEGDNLLVRHETWFYPEHQQSITFVGGDILEVGAIDAETSEDGEITYSELKPEDFEFDMDYDGVASALGDITIEKVDMVPELDDEEISTYIAEHVLFTIEYDRLTYFETVGLDLSEEEEI